MSDEAKAPRWDTLHEALTRAARLGLTEDIVNREDSNDYMNESVYYTGEMTTRGAMIADLQRIAASQFPDDRAEQQACVSRFLQGFERGVAARAAYLSYRRVPLLGEEVAS